MFSKKDYWVGAAILLGGVFICTIIYFRAPTLAKQFELPDPPVLMAGSETTLNIVYTAVELHPRIQGHFVSCNDIFPAVKNSEKYHLVDRVISNDLLVCGWSH